MSRKTIDNYAAFYALLKKMPGADKEQLVETFTLGRTSSLREMNPGEYKAMIAAMQTAAGQGSEAKRKARSAALHQLQLVGVETSDWDAVNRYVSQPRISGKVFAALSVQELQALTRKLRAIRQKREIDAQVQVMSKYKAVGSC